MSIYYATAFTTEPVGGIKQVFRHVEVLAAAGWDSRVLGLGATEAPRWLSHSQPISTVRQTPYRRLATRLARVHPKLWPMDLNPLQELDHPNGVSILHEGQETPVRLMPNDILVLPEHFGVDLRRPQVKCKVVIFNQNVHYMFRGFKPGVALEGSLCADESVPSIVVSRHNYECLRYTFPRRQVHLTTNGIDTRQFFFNKEKRKQIAFMPRKLPDDIAHVLAMLELRGSLKGWELCPIDGVGEETVARLMRESLVFLSTCSIEGFGLPALEALLSGCVVVGYTGMAAGEFLDETTGYPIPQEDRLAFARRLEDLLDDLSKHPERHLERSARIAQRLQDQYSLERERDAIVQAWRQLAPDHDPDRADYLRSRFSSSR